MNVANIMSEQLQGGLGRDSCRIVGGGAVAFEDRNAVADHVDDIDLRRAHGPRAVMRLLNRDIGIVIGVMIVRPGVPRDVWVGIGEGNHLGVVGIEMIFDRIGPGRGIFELANAECMDAREGVW